MSKYGNECPDCKNCKRSGDCSCYAKCAEFRAWFHGAWNEIRRCAEKLKKDNQC